MREESIRIIFDVTVFIAKDAILSNDLNLVPRAFPLEFPCQLLQGKSSVNEVGMIRIRIRISDSRLLVSW